MSSSVKELALLHVKQSPVTETRVCGRCSRVRPLVLFPKTGVPDHPYSDWCEVCNARFEQDRKDHLAVESVKRSYHRRLVKQTTPIPVVVARRTKALWGAARTRAWRHGVPFSLSESWVADRLNAGVCEVTGLAFRVDKCGPRNNFCPSVDRKDPDKGYTDENAQMVVWIYNAAKGAGSHDDVLLMAEALGHTASLNRLRSVGMARVDSPPNPEAPTEMSKLS